MRKRWAGYAVWLLLTACLYFFENNTGTRTVLIGSLLFPLIPFLRSVFFAEDGTIRGKTPKTQTVRAFAHRETEEPGDVRLYQPGDPVRRIHWKLSAKKDELLLRETVTEQTIIETEQNAAPDETGQKRAFRKHLLWISAGLMVLCAMLLMLVPEARHGAESLCNRVYAASEAVNAYAYEYFPVRKDQSVAMAVILLVSLLAGLASLMVLLRSRTMALGTMAAITFFQIYFGLPLPAWGNILLYGFLAGWMIRRPADRKGILIGMVSLLLVSLLVVFLFPGVDADTEAVSENVRDVLSRMAQQITGTVQELPEGDTETRHAHTLSLQSGSDEARADREYRLVTVEEEQISMPQWINWMKIILLLLLVIALVVLPFAPFLLLNARKKKARKAREAFDSDNVSEAVCAIFRQVIVWLRETGHDPGNLLYRNWTDTLPADLPEGYAARFADCVKDYEEAAYSVHDLPEEKRRQALSLLKETEAALLKTASRRQRLRIRYWMCLCE